MSPTAIAATTVLEGSEIPAMPCSCSSTATGTRRGLMGSHGHVSEAECAAVIRKLFGRDLFGVT